MPSLREALRIAFHIEKSAPQETQRPTGIDSLLGNGGYVFLSAAESLPCPDMRYRLTTVKYIILGLVGEIIRRGFRESSTA